MNSISNYTLDFERLPLIRPFGFKGGSFHEKWILHCSLQDAAGLRAPSQSGLAVLWSDSRVFSHHSECTGNMLMACILERALRLSIGWDVDSPPDCFHRAVRAVTDYAYAITGLTDLAPTFVHNALVGFDNACWNLHSLQRDNPPFDQLLPAQYATHLTTRQKQLALIPLIGYSTDEQSIAAMITSGYPVLKIKLGQQDDTEAMIAQDSKRIRRIHQLAKDATVKGTSDGRIRYYLDANGRYPDRQALDQLLNAIDVDTLLSRTLLLEEPFPEQVTTSVADLPFLVVCDESAHSAESIHQRALQGYRAVALKPAGKSLSLTLEMLSAAAAHGMHCFVADSACPPTLLDWNRLIAARLPSLPDLDCGLMESNGAQFYRDWQSLCAQHPDSRQPWSNPQGGFAELPSSWFDRSLPS